MAAFFLSLLPQFVPGGTGSVATSLLFGLLFCLMTLCWLAAYSVGVDRARRLINRVPVRRTLETATGGLLVVLGARLAFDQR